MKGMGFYGHDFLVIKEDKDLISEGIIRLIMTNWRERVGRPFLGANLKASLFELNDDAAYGEIESNLTTAVEDFEPRVTVEGLKLTPHLDDNALQIQLAYKMKGEDEVTSPEIIDITYELDN